jgi:CheY-like chemotaxis protein
MKARLANSNLQALEEMPFEMVKLGRRARTVRPGVVRGKTIKLSDVTHASSPETAHRTILLVDDCDATRFFTKWFLGSFGYKVDTARTAEEALSLFNPSTHDIIITDNSMPGISGAEMAHVVKLRSPSTPVLMYTGHVPNDHSCVDAVLQRPTQLLVMNEAIELLFARQVSQGLKLDYTSAMGCSTCPFGKSA